MAEEKIVITIDDAALDDALVKMDLALGKSGNVQESTDEAAGLWMDLEKNTKELPTLSREMRLIISQIPELRSALGLITQLKMMGAGNIALVVTQLVIQLYRMIVRAREAQERAEKDYQRMIMEYRHFTTRGEFEQWQEDDKTRRESYRSRPN